MKKRLPAIFLITILMAACDDQPRTVLHAQKPIKHKIAPKPANIPKDTVCLVAVGDMMLGSAYPTKANLPTDSVAVNSFKVAIKQFTNADVVFGNLEGTFADSGTPYGKKKLKPYSFRMPVKYGAIFKQAGFTLLSVANNHIDDFGGSGRKSTTHTLDSLGIYYAGLQSSPTVIFTVNGIKYGFCAFAPNSYVVSLNDQKNATGIIQELKQQVDIVIVSFHGGGEGIGFEHVPFKVERYIGENRGDVHAFAHNAIDAGADIIFGSGPHVSRAMELYNKRLIAYSLGNFCTYKCVSVAGVCGLAPLLKVYLNKKGEFLNGRIVAFKQSHDKGLKRDSLNRVVARIKYLTETDFPQSGLNIDSSGVISTAN